MQFDVQFDEIDLKRRAMDMTACGPISASGVWGQASVVDACACGGCARVRGSVYIEAAHARPEA